MSVAGYMHTHSSGRGKPLSTWHYSVYFTSQPPIYEHDMHNMHDMYMICT